MNSTALSDGWVVGALLAMQKAGYWDKNDAGFMGSIVEYYTTVGHVTPGMVDYARTKLDQYARRVACLEVQPVEDLVVRNPAPEGVCPFRAKLVNGSLHMFSDYYDETNHQRMRTLEGRRWKPEHNAWEAKLVITNVRDLKQWGYAFDEQLEAWHAEYEAGVGELDIPGLAGELFGYQCDGVRFLDDLNGNALIGDEMGLGKTVQALAWLLKNPQVRPVLVVCPAHLRGNWEQETRKWTPIEPQVLWNGPKEGTRLAGELVIISYNVLKKWLPSLLAWQPQAVVFDEMHYVKNAKRQRSKATKELAEAVPHVIGLTGTPITTRPADIYNQVKVVRPDVLPGWWTFAKRFCGAVKTEHGWDFTGATHTRELHQLLSRRVMLRRLKDDVLKDLPPKVRSALPLELSNQPEYAELDARFRQWCENHEEQIRKGRVKMDELALVHEMTSVCWEGKREAVAQWIEDYLEQEEKLVVMTTRTDAVEYLVQRFGTEAVRLDGKVPQKKRPEVVKRFQEDPGVRLLVGNIEVAGTGHTLTASRAVAMLQVPWNPGTAVQAEDRVHRIGQEADSVAAYYLVATGTIEHRQAALLDHKAQVIAQVVDGKGEPPQGYITELLMQYVTKKEAA